MKVKYLLLIVSLLISTVSIGQNNVAELSEYFYPFMEFEYTVTPNIKDPITRASYRINSQGNILTKKVYTMQGMYSRPLSETSYQLEFDKENNAIVSNKQVIFNALTRTSRTSNDRIVLFIIPEEGSTSAWEETVNGEVYKCRAQYSYLKSGDIIRKVIRIKKGCEVNKKKFTECEYWSKNQSRIATYGKWGDGQINLTEISDLVDPPYEFEEISEEEYNQLKLENFRQELKVNPTVLSQGSSIYNAIKHKIDNSIKSDYQNKYFTKEISITVAISADSQIAVNVTSDSDKAKNIVESRTNEIVMALLEDNTIRQEKVIEPVTKTECIKPMIASFNYTFTQKRMPVSLAFKKGDWKCLNEDEIPEDIWNAAVRIASDKLKEDPKAKKQQLNIFYMESPLGRYVY